MECAAAVLGAGLVVEHEPRLVLVEACSLPRHHPAAAGRGARPAGRRGADEHREDVGDAAERPERGHGDAPRQERQHVRGAEREHRDGAAPRRAHAPEVSAVVR